MQRVIVMLLATVLMVSCNQSGEKNKAETQGIERAQIVSATVEEILATPAEYDGKEVAISGMVTHVCRHGGQKCFVVGADGETQIRIVPGGNIDEFKIDLEGSTVAFKGVFKVLNALEAEEHIEDHESQAHHTTEMAHTQAEKADYYVEATEFREVTQ